MQFTLRKMFVATATNNHSESSHAAPHPAKPLLLVIGGLCAMYGMFGIPVGMFVGPHILIPAVVMAAFGSAALWIGLRPYDRLGRIATIVWAMLAIAVLVVAVALEPPTGADVEGIAFLALLLLMIVSILTVAIRKRSVQPAPELRL